MDRWPDTGLLDGQTDCWKNNVALAHTYREGKLYRKFD